MATLTVRGLDERTHAALRVRAARHGRSMESEVRAILDELLSAPSAPSGLGSRIHARFTAMDDAEFDVPAREERPRPAEFDA